MSLRPLLFLLLLSGPARAADESRPVVIAKLLRAPTVPHCGGIHWGEVLEYEVVKVERGAFEGKRLLVMVGCPELSRRSYGADAGTLESFEAGALHRLELSETPLPGSAPSFTRPKGKFFYLVRADPGPK
jgi:hypothetical protein